MGRKDGQIDMYEIFRLAGVIGAVSFFIFIILSATGWYRDFKNFDIFLYIMCGGLLLGFISDYLK